MLTAERLHEVLTYWPETGDFYWTNSSRPGWNGKRAGSPSSGGYLQILVDGRPHRAHRLAWLYMTGAWPELEVDHRDRDRTNNRWDNLRLSTDSQQCRNRSTTRLNTTGILGVSRTRAGWRVQITTWQGIRISEYYADLFEAVCRRKSLELREGY